MDDDAVRFLKIFTFLSLEEIEEIGKEFDQARHQRLAQKVLAREVVTLVHGKKLTNKLFTSLNNSSLVTLKLSQHATAKLPSTVSQHVNFSR